MNYIKKLEGEDIKGNQIYLDLDAIYKASYNALEGLDASCGGDPLTPVIGDKNNG